MQSNTNAGQPENREIQSKNAASEGNSEAAFQVAPPGFEPGLTDPESVVLPLHYGAITGFSACGREDSDGLAGRQETNFARVSQIPDWLALHSQAASDSHRQQSGNSTSRECQAETAPWGSYFWIAAAHVSVGRSV